jgi:hypothetical protein
LGAPISETHKLVAMGCARLEALFVIKAGDNRRQGKQAQSQRIA